MPNLNRRLNDLEQAAGQGADCSIPKVIVLVAVSPDDKVGRTAFISIMCPNGGGRLHQYTRGDDEDVQAFLERAGEGHPP